VEVRVVVRDSKGQPVSGLNREGFEVLDNGKPQAITSFSVESPRHATAPVSAAAVSPGETSPPSGAVAPAPRFVAFFFDDMNMRLGDLVPARTAAEIFIKGGLEHGNRIGVFTSSSFVTLEFTNDTAKLLSALAQLRPRFKPSDDGSTACPRISPYQAHLIINMNDQQAFDLAVAEGIALGCLRSAPRSMLGSIVQNRANEILSVTESFSQDTIGSISQVIRYLGKMPGRRTLLLASSGFLTSTSLLRRRQDNLIDVALRAGVVINSLDAKGLVAVAPGGDPAQGRSIALRPDMMAYADSLRSEEREVFGDTLAILAQGTGGRFFHNNNDLDRGIRELVEAPEITYVLGFSPENLKHDGSYHSLKVKMLGAVPFHVEARRGYFAPDKTKPLPLSNPEKLDAAVLSFEAVSGMPIDVSTHAEATGTGEAVLKVVIRLDVRNLRFQRRADRSAQRLRFVTALFDSQGKFLAAVEAVVDLSLKDSTLATLSASGLEQKLTMQAPPGTYRLRTVAQELLSGNLGALTRSVQIQ
jgi:VWFA-related protein